MAKGNQRYTVKAVLVVAVITVVVAALVTRIPALRAVVNG